MHEVVGKPSVVGKQEQSRGILVQPSYRKDSFPDVDNVHDSRVFLARAGRNDTPWLVDFVIDKIGNLGYRLVADNDFVDGRIDNLSDRGDFAIDGNQSTCDEFFGFPPGRKSRLGQVFVDSEGNGFHNGLFNDSYFFVELRLEHFPNLAFGEFREFDDILPYRSFGTHEKIRMVRGNLHATDPGTLESRLIDEFPSARPSRIGKVRTTGKPRRLFGAAGSLHFRDGHFGERVFHLNVFQMEFR